MFDFDTIRDRKTSDSVKWRKYKDRDVLPMWVADMDFPSPPTVIHALQERVAHGIFGYGHPGRKFTRTVVDHLWRTYEWSVKPGWVVWLPGLVCGLNVTCRSVGKPGDSVVTTVPVYPPFLSAPKLSHRNLITTRMVQSPEGWRFNFSEMESMLTNNTHLFILCNPHNPTGRVFSRNELSRLADLCMRNNIIICSDEIHCDLILDPKSRHLPLATLSPEIADRTITLMAPSKTYNIPGLSCAFAIIPNTGLRKQFKQAMAGIVPHVNVLGMAATQAAYQNGGAWLSALIRYLQGNRDRVSEFVEQTNCLEMSKIEATYLAWIDARKLNIPDAFKHFEDYGVGLSNGVEFDGNGFLRLNFGCSGNLLAKALERMTRAIASVSQS